MNRILLSLALIFSSLSSFGQGFPSTAVNYGLPTGGYVSSSHNYGYFDYYEVGSYAANSNGWGVMDINNDQKPDLIVTCQGSGTYRDCFGLPNSQYWKVYLNNGSGFSTTATNWTLPAGGYRDGSHLYGYFALFETGSYYSGSNGWSVTDMNNDHLPDLVVTCEGTGTYRDGFGLPSSQYWKVYLNNGTGFSTTAINYTLPSGGYKDGSHTYGWFALYETGSYYSGSNGWAVNDLNFDGFQDLVVTCEGTGSYRDCFGVPTSQYWKVYFGSTSGFSTTATNWTLPTGGFKDGSHTYGYFNTNEVGGYYLNCNGWSTMDMNNDGRADLVVTSQGTGSYKDCFGVPNTQYWKVYLNNGTGFSTSAINWTLPTGGLIGSGHTYGYYDINGSPSYENLSNGWSLCDLNNDDQPDLVVTSQGNGSYGNCFSSGSNYFWKVYYNTGSSFAPTSVNWSLPAGGLISGNHSYGFYMLANGGSNDLNSNGWTVDDIDGDGKNDLIVVSNGTGTYRDCFGLPTSQYWKVYLNTYSPTALFEYTNASSSIILAPNPAKSLIHIASKQSLINQPYSVVSTTGKKVLDGVFSNEEESIDISSLATGIYLLQIGTESKNSSKFIKQ
jgi:Secretion system C-terminal sorting domain